MADSKISALTSGGGFQPGDFVPIDRSGSNFKVTPIGVPVLVYRYTVAGSDKASIDTGVDTADAGSNDWTNGDLLEIMITARSDDAAAVANITGTFNNDSAGNYDRMVIESNNGAPSGSSVQAATAVQLIVHGSGGSASYPAISVLSVPHFAGTTFFKMYQWTEGTVDATGGNNWGRLRIGGWRSTAAITRFAIAAAGGQKLKVGSQLLIYKRLAS